MLPLKLLAPLAALGAVASGNSAVASLHTPIAVRHSLYDSHQLWATVDVCNPKDKPNTLGIRGSMPIDGRPGDTIFMRFRVQYQESSTKEGSAKRWVNIAKGADSGFQQVRSVGSASQSGRNFQLVPTPGAFTLRGVVSFQWRHGAHLVHAATRPTTAGHVSLAGADPLGFSAATCTIG